MNENVKTQSVSLRLDPVGESGEDEAVLFWGRTGFDLIDTPEAACRGRCVGLVNHRIKK